MRIDKITVQNFRCFENMTLDLHPEFNILIGENGAGKTAMLESLAVAVGRWVQRLSGFPAEDARENDTRLVGRTIGQGTIFEPQPPLRVVAYGMVGGKSVEWSRRLGNEVDQARWEWESDAWLLADEMAQAVRNFEPVILPLIAYYQAKRLWSTPSEEDNYFPLKQVELSRMEGFHHALPVRADTQELSRWLEYQDRVAYQERRESPIYRTVLNAMKSVVERASDVRYDARRLEIVIEFENGEMRPIRQLSAGQRNMLALAGDIAMRMARLNPQFNSDVLKETPGVVLIDELDLHLHPHWQRHVVADLRRTFPKVQFVTTTHSPQIISEVQPESVTVLANEGHKIVAYKAHQAYGLDTNGVLQRLMDDPGRPVPAQEKIDAVDDAIEEGDLDQARNLVGDLRRLLHGDDPEVARLEASINNLEALALDAVD